MSDWAGYALADFLMFTPATYARQFELVNQSTWPLHVAMLAAGLAIGWRGHRAPVGWRSACGLLAVAWLATAWWFVYLRYAPISLAGGWVTALFVVESLLLAAVAVAGGLRPLATRAQAWPGRVLLGYALIGHPLMLLAGGRDPDALEWFGLAPDPTALATLGLLLMQRGFAAIVAAAIPLAWCLFSALTWLAMGLSLGLLPPLLVLLAAMARLLASDRAVTPDRG